MPNETLCLFMPALDTAHSGNQSLERVKLLRRLAGVGITGQTLSWLRARNIHIVSWGELNCVLPVGNLVIIEGGFLTHPQPSLIDQERNGAVIGVVVDGPVCKNHIGLFLFQIGRASCR